MLTRLTRPCDPGNAPPRPMPVLLGTQAPIPTGRKYPMAHLRTFGALTAAALAITGLLASPAEAGNQAPGRHDSTGRAPVTFGAAAWGSTVRTAGGVVTSGRTALASLGCTNRTGLERANNVAGVDLGELGTVG